MLAQSSVDRAKDKLWRLRGGPGLFEFDPSERGIHANPEQASLVCKRGKRLGPRGEVFVDIRKRLLTHRGSRERVVKFPSGLAPSPRLPPSLTVSTDSSLLKSHNPHRRHLTDCPPQSINSASISSLLTFTLLQYACTPTTHRNPLPHLLVPPCRGAGQPWQARQFVAGSTST